MRCRTRWAVLGGVLAVALSVASVAWACVPEGTSKTLDVNPREARPGQQITVAAAPNASKNPIVVRLNAADGPVLGTIAVDGAPIPGEGFKATFTVPPDLQPGQHAVIAVQEGVDWEPALLSVTDERGRVPRAPQSVAAAEAAAAPADDTLPRGVALALALGLGGVAVRRAVQHRRGVGHGVERAGPWHLVQPSALVLVAGAVAYAALRPRLDGSLLVLGVIALGAGLVGRGRTHFIPVGLVLASWGAAIWLISESVIPRDRSQAAAVIGLGVGMLLSAKLARSREQRAEWLYTGALCAFNAGFSYYVLFDLPVAFANWSAFTIFLVGWAVWEQYRAGLVAEGVPGREPTTAEGAGVRTAAVDDDPPAEPAFEPSLS